MSTPATTPAARLARLLRPGGNPLARGADRLEAAVLVLAMTIAVVLVPVMLTFGSLTFASLDDVAERQAATRHEFVAVLLQDAPTAVVVRGGAVGGRSVVRAQWRMPAGEVRTGQVEVVNGSKAGQEVPVWLDDSGQPVDPPLSTESVVAEAVAVAVLGWLVAAGLLTLACYGLHAALQRRRYRAWDADWARVAPDWHDHRR
jgi:hypothetical protein